MISNAHCLNMSENELLQQEKDRVSLVLKDAAGMSVRSFVENACDDIACYRGCDEFISNEFVEAKELCLKIFSSTELMTCYKTYIEERIFTELDEPRQIFTDPKCF